MPHSQWLLGHPNAQNNKALARIETAMARLPNILEREIIACQKTLEQKISDQGPASQRVDPHLLGLALHELTTERKILAVHHHASTTHSPWYSNARLREPEIRDKLERVAPLYASVSTGPFPNLVGDALEVIVENCLTQLNRSNPRYGFLGSFDLSTKNRQGRFPKTEPPNTLSGLTSPKIPDFYVSGFAFGTVCIECKNLREWVYPDSNLLKDLIRKAIDTDTVPCLIARRIHYTTTANLLIPAGIISHERYYQYYPSESAHLAASVKEKRSLGFSDVRATELPDKRTVKFITNDLPSVGDYMAERFRRNRKALSAFLAGDIYLAQLYNEIGSPAAGNWIDYPNEDPMAF